MESYNNMTYNIDEADFFDGTSKFERILLAVFLLNWRIILHPFKSYECYLLSELKIHLESVKRKYNKLQFQEEI